MLKSAKVVAVGCVAALFGVAGTSWGAEETTKPSRHMEKALKACSDPYTANKFDEAIRLCRDAQNQPNRSAYDNFLINQVLGVSYAKSKRFPEAYPVLKEVVNSPYVESKFKGIFLVTLTQIAYTQKDYDEALQWSQKAIDAGQDSADLRNIIASTYYAQGKYKDCIASSAEILSRAEKSGARPSENNLQMLFTCQNKAGDTSGQGRTLEKLLTYYPTPTIWSNAMITLQQMSRNANDSRLTLQVYRLMQEVGNLKNYQQYGDYVALSIDKGSPGEALVIITQALSKGVFGEEQKREKAQMERYSESAKKLVATAKEGIAKEEAEAMRTGNADLMVAVGNSYLWNVGDAAKAVSLISQGIAKGGLKTIPVNDAYVTLGLAHYKAKNGAEAQKAFNKVDKHDAYEQLAKLWQLKVR